MYKTIIGSIAGVSMVLACAGSAAARTRLSWTLPSSATAGATVPFTWSASHLPSHGRLVVQRQEGTSKTWATVVRLPLRKTGSAALPALALGVYSVRIVVFNRHGSLRTQHEASLDVFGTVPLGTLEAGYTGAENVGTPGQPTSYESSTGIFVFVLGIPEYWSDNQTPFVPPSVAGARNHCRSIHVDFLPGTIDTGITPPVGYVGNLTIVQQSRDPVTVSEPYESTGALDVQLTPGQSWGFRTSHSGTGPGDDVAFYLNGSASCDSTRPWYGS